MILLTGFMIICIVVAFCVFAVLPLLFVALPFVPMAPALSVALVMSCYCPWMSLILGFSLLFLRVFLNSNKTHASSNTSSKVCKNNPRINHVDEIDNMDNLEDNGAQDESDESDVTDESDSPIPARVIVNRGNRAIDRRHPVRIRRPVPRYGFLPRFYKK